MCNKCLKNVVLWRLNEDMRVYMCMWLWTFRCIWWKGERRRRMVWKKERERKKRWGVRNLHSSKERLCTRLNLYLEFRIIRIIRFIKIIRIISVIPHFKGVSYSHYCTAHTHTYIYIYIYTYHNSAVLNPPNPVFSDPSLTDGPPGAGPEFLLSPARFPFPPPFSAELLLLAGSEFPEIPDDKLDDEPLKFDELVVVDDEGCNDFPVRFFAWICWIFLARSSSSQFICRILIFRENSGSTWVLRTAEVKVAFMSLLTHSDTKDWKPRELDR